MEIFKLIHYRFFALILGIARVIYTCCVSMKLERSRDIPAFKGKNWRERWALFNQAIERDPWIIGLRSLGFFLIFAPAVMLASWLANRFSPHQFWLAYVGIIVLLYPVYWLFESLFITPRIRRALESGVKPMA
jgi:hypothetical protein